MKDDKNEIPLEMYQLTEGPLLKSIYTYHLENITRLLMLDKDFLFTKENDEDYIIIDNNKYNWTSIINYANLDHIELHKDDFKLYSRHAITTNRPPYIISRLKPNNEQLYRRELYREYYLHNYILPDPQISIEEMHAINIYTGGFFNKMNALLRGKFNFEYENSLHTREAIIQSVMCASGLRKIPQTTITEVYRGNSMPSDEEHQARVKAATNHGVIQLSGFVSSSTEKNSSFEYKPVAWQITQLKGAYIAPISQQPHEKEFLIPPTEIQITEYVFDKNRHYFKGRLVSDVANKEPSESQNNVPIRIKMPELIDRTPFEELRDQLKQSDSLNKHHTVLKASKTNVKTSHDFASVMEFLSPEQRALFFKIMNKNNNLINMTKNTDDFIQVMMFLSPAQCKQICINMGKTLHNIKFQDIVISEKLTRYLLPEQLTIINQSLNALTLDKHITSFLIKASLFIHQAKNLPKFKKAAFEIDLLHNHLKEHWMNKSIFDRNARELLNNPAFITLINTIELHVGRKTCLKNLPILRELNKGFKALKDEITILYKTPLQSGHNTKELKQRLALLKESDTTLDTTLKNNIAQ